MEWVPTARGEIPPGRRPVEGGYESNGAHLFHALGTFSGVQVPGKTGVHLKSGHFAWNAKEQILRDNYAILCWR
jgi:hypothetical protein